MRVRVYRARGLMPWVVTVTAPSPVDRVVWAVATIVCTSHAYAIAYADALAHAALMAKAAADLTVERATEKAGA